MALAQYIGPKREWLRAWAATPVPRWTPIARIPLPDDLRLRHYWDSATLRPMPLYGRRVLAVESTTPVWPPVLSVRVPGRVSERDVLMLLDSGH